MSSFDRIVEEKIKAAMEAGDFDNLRGKGKPLKLDQDPLADPAWLMASTLLKEQGFSLPWIDLRKEIEADLENSRRQLLLAWEQHQEGQMGGLPDSTWESALENFQSEVAALNRRIFSYNLQVPDIRFQRPAIHITHELLRMEIHHQA